MDSEKHTGDPLDLSKEDLEALFESTFNASMDEPHKTPQKEPLNTPLFDSSFAGSKSIVEKKTGVSQTKNFKADGDFKRVKSSLRIKYEAEVSAIKKASGDLEGIRQTLGLSKRKIAQLLLVDPSAWTRWTQANGEAPPHIYRALQWYLLLQDKNPEYKSAFWLNSVASPSISAHEMENIHKEVVQKARESLDLSIPYIEAPTVNLAPLKKQLISSQKQVKKLNQRLKWLIVSQLILLFSVLVLFSFK